jgi:hypothetical protein
VPNLAATMAGSPVLVSGFVDLRKTLAAGELTGVERETVALAVSLVAHGISQAPLDRAFQPQAWAKATA